MTTSGQRKILEMSDGLRRRNVEIVEEPKIDFYEKIKTLDAFTKVAEEAEGEKTVTGGFFSFLAFSVMTILFVCEIWIWIFHTNFKYDFDVDVDFKDKLNLNFDITVNSPCFGIGAGSFGHKKWGESSRFLYSLYFATRNSNQMTIGKTHFTLKK